MVLDGYTDQAPLPPPACHRTLSRAVHLAALTLVNRLQLLALCWLSSAVSASPLSCMVYNQGNAR
jgi:hypothetical protein